MPATTPEEICRLFQQYMAEGDVDSVLSVYDPEAVFLNRSGEIRRGEEALREELARPLLPFTACPKRRCTPWMINCGGPADKA